MIYDPSNYNPDPAYLRGIIARLGISQRHAARALGMGESSLRSYLTKPSGHPYMLQHALESLEKYGLPEHKPA